MFGKNITRCVVDVNFLCTNTVESKYTETRKLLLLTSITTFLTESGCDITLRNNGLDVHGGLIVVLKK